MDLEPQELFDIRQDVRCVPRVKATARNEPLSIESNVLCNEGIDTRREPDHLRRHIID